MESESWGYIPGKESLLPPQFPQILNFLMKLGQFYLIYAANCFPSLLLPWQEKTSLLSHFAEELMKTLRYLAPYLIQVPWMKKFLSFPSSDKGFITTLAYYWSKETLNGNVTLGWLLYVPFGCIGCVLLQVHRWKKYIVLKMSTFPHIWGIIFFPFCFSSLFSFSSSSSCSSFVCVTA